MGALSILTASRRRCALLVLFAAFAVYAPSLANDLVWDDSDLISLVGSMAREGGLPGLFRSEMNLGMKTGYYRPVTLASLWLDAHAAGFLPGAYHLTNVLLHAANSLLVLSLLEALLPSLAAALFGALVFALHPAHTEAVSWVSARSDLLVCLFTLLACGAWMKEREGGAVPRPWQLRSAGFVCFALALLSKESAVALLPLVLAWGLLLAEDERHGGDRPRRRWVWPALLAAAIVFVIVLRVGLVPSGGKIALDRYGSASLFGALGSPGALLKVWTIYLGLLVIPWPLNAYYHPPGLSVPWTLLLGAVLFLAACATLAGRSSRRAGLLALSWVVVFLLPVGIVTPTGTPIAERYLYLPSVGACLLAGMVWRRFQDLSGPKGLPAVLATLCLALLAAVTIWRERIWKTELALYTDMVRTSPAAPHPHTNLGFAHLAAGRHREAAAEFEEALRLLPGDANARINLAAAYQKLGRDEDALLTIRALVEREPGNALARTSLGVLHIKAGRHAEAVAELRAAVALDPGLAQAHYNLGLGYAGLRQWREASESLKNAVRLNPDYAEAHLALGSVLLELGDVAAAESVRRTLTGLDPARAERLSALMRRAAPEERRLP
jgi:Flp pilus assembly protein TadD